MLIFYAVGLQIRLSGLPMRPARSDLQSDRFEYKYFQYAHSSYYSFYDCLVNPLVAIFFRITNAYILCSRIANPTEREIFENYSFFL